MRVQIGKNTWFYLTITRLNWLDAHKEARERERERERQNENAQF